jgi:hypothetical protein
MGQKRPFGARNSYSASRAYAIGRPAWQALAGTSEAIPAKKDMGLDVSGSLETLVCADVEIFTVWHVGPANWRGRAMGTSAVTQGRTRRLQSFAITWVMGRNPHSPRGGYGDSATRKRAASKCFLVRSSAGSCRTWLISGLGEGCARKYELLAIIRCDRARSSCSA